MPLEQFAARAYDRVAPGLPEQRAVNVFYAPTPAGPSKFALQQRWGLSLITSVGSGPTRGLYTQEGFFNGDLFTVSGNNLYRQSSDLGALTTGGVARMTGSGTQLGIVIGGKFYIYDGATVTWVQNDKSASPLPEFIGVIAIAQRFVLLCRNAVFYWSDIGDGTMIDALNFATAESSPDGAVEIAKLGDEFAILGDTSTEWWFITGDADAPFQRSSNRTYSRGCASQGTVVQADNALVFVGEDRIVYRSSQVPQAISTHGIESRLAECSDMSSCTAFQITFGGHPFYVLNIYLEGTFAYDFSSGEWSQWTTYNQTMFRCPWGLMDSGVVVMGDRGDGSIWTMMSNLNTDGSDPIERIGSAFIRRPAKFDTLRNLTITGTRGAGTGDIEVRVSDDGINWSDWFSKALSGTGAGALKARWMQGLGTLGSPGKSIEVRVVDDVSITLSGLTYNESRP